jgi:hypothetical protein
VAGEVGEEQLGGDVELRVHEVVRGRDADVGVGLGLLREDAMWAFLGEPGAAFPTEAVQPPDPEMDADFQEYVTPSGGGTSACADGVAPNIAPARMITAKMGLRAFIRFLLRVNPVGTRFILDSVRNLRLVVP